MSKQAHRLLSIDALRGVAALLVLVYHSRAIPWIGMSEFFHHHHAWSWNPDVWLGWITSPFRFGLLGVNLLFVLSGYCIHRNQARGLAAGDLVKLDLPRYAFRRFFRIYPTYVAALIFTGLVLYMFVPWLATKGFPPVAVGEYHSWYGFFMNLLTMQQILVPPYEYVFWSLSIEIHLYIAYPVLLWISRRWGAGRMLLVSFIASVIYLAVMYSLQKFPSVTLAFSFLHFIGSWFTWCVGAYLAELQTRRAKLPKLPHAVWCVICLAFISIGAALSFASMELQKYDGSRQLVLTLKNLPLMAIGDFFSAVAIGGFMYAALSPRADRIWTSIPGRSLAFVGMFSYSLYAIHVPVLVTFTTLSGGKHESMLYPLAACLCALLVAYGFFNLIERWTLTPPKGFFATKKPLHKAPIEAASAEVPVGQG